MILETSRNRQVGESGLSSRTQFSGTVTPSLPMLEMSAAATLEVCRWLTSSLVVWCVHADTARLEKLYSKGTNDFLSNVDLDTAQPVLLGWRRAAGRGTISAAVCHAVRAAANIQKASWAFVL